VAAHLAWPAALGYALWLVFGLCVLGALLEGRRGALWLEAVRVLAMTVVPLASGRWFGVAHLDVRLGLAMLAVFGLSALALPWLGGRGWRHAAAASRGALPG
jgi:hypothetical protein